MHGTASFRDGTNRADHSRREVRPMPDNKRSGKGRGQRGKEPEAEQDAPRDHETIEEEPAPGYIELGGMSSYSTRTALGDEAKTIDVASDEPTDRAEDGPELVKRLVEADDDEPLWHRGLRPGPGGHEEGLSVEPEELGRTFLQDATDAPALETAELGDPTYDQELAPEEGRATDRDRRRPASPRVGSDADERLAPAFIAQQLEQLVRRHQGLYMRWAVARTRGEVSDVEVNGQHFAVVSDDELAARIEQAAPDLEAYLFDKASQQIVAP